MTIFRMHNSSNALSIELLKLRETKKSAIFLGKPDLIALDVPSPDDKASRIRCQAHALLAVAQTRRGRLQLTRECRRMNYIIAQLISHRGDKTLIKQAHRHRHGDNSPHNQDTFRRSHCNKQQNATAHYHRLPPVASPPYSNCGICHKNDEQQQAQLGGKHQWIGHAHRNRNGFSKEWDVPQRGYFPIIDIWPESEIEDQRQRSRTDDRPREPPPPRSQIKTHKADKRHDHHPHRNM